MNTKLVCRTDGKVTAKAELKSGYWSVKLYDNDWLVANLKYETANEAYDAAYSWAEAH